MVQSCDAIYCDRRYDDSRVCCNSYTISRRHIIGLQTPRADHTWVLIYAGYIIWIICSSKASERCLWYITSEKMRVQWNWIMTSFRRRVNCSRLVSGNHLPWNTSKTAATKIVYIDASNTSPRLGAKQHTCGYVPTFQHCTSTFSKPVQLSVVGFNYVHLHNSGGQYMWNIEIHVCGNNIVIACTCMMCMVTQFGTVDLPVCM